MKGSRTVYDQEMHWRRKARYALEDGNTAKVAEYLANADKLGPPERKGKIGTLKASRIAIKYSTLEDRLTALESDIKILKKRPLK